MGEKETTRSVGAGQATEIVEREGGGDADESARASNLNLSKSNINREVGGGDSGAEASGRAINLNTSRSNVERAGAESGATRSE